LGDTFKILNGFPLVTEKPLCMHSLVPFFCEEFNLKTRDYRLGIGSETHGYQTGEILRRIEEVLLQEKPAWVVVYSDTNSTLGGVLVAAKLSIPVAHVGVGLRANDKYEPFLKRLNEGLLRTF